MFNSSVLDVAIGLIFVYLLLSLAASSAREGLEAFLKKRAQDLLAGIKELIGEQADLALNQAADPQNAGTEEENQPLVARIYNHGLVNALYSGTYASAQPKQLPSYIPSKNFALAMISFWKQAQASNTIDKLPPNVQTAFRAFEHAAEAQPAKYEKLVEDWYNSAMDRISGKYKRRTQNILFVIGVLLSVFVNADTIQIAQRLSTDQTLRAAVITAAQKESDRQTLAQDAADQNTSVKKSIQKIKLNLTDLDGVGLPLGWNNEFEQWREDRKYHSDSYLDAVWNFSITCMQHLPGWLLTALALSLGAPFWFDMLNKFMVVRSTVKPNEKSGEERSKDGLPPPPAPVPSAPPSSKPSPTVDTTILNPGVVLLGTNEPGASGQGASNPLPEGSGN